LGELVRHCRDLNAHRRRRCVAAGLHKLKELVARARLYDALGVHRAATANAYGAGCGSPALGFVPGASGRPVLGQTGSATIVDAPTPFAAVAMGWSNLSFGPLPLPLPLDSIGMPGCSLLQSADILGLGTLPLTASTCSFSLAIPGVPSLIGMHLYLQAYANCARSESFADRHQQRHRLGPRRQLTGAFSSPHFAKRRRRRAG
jgi:hypothetical protein